VPEELSPIHRLAEVPLPIRSDRGAIAPEGFACMCLDSGDGSIRVALSGELDIATATEFDRALRTAQRRARSVTLDLRRLSFMDCCGLAALMAAASRARADGDRFRVVRGAAVDRLFAITGVDLELELTSEVA
jgi:anti-sigma B factor antagonist